MNDQFSRGGVPPHWQVYDGRYKGDGANCTSARHVFVVGGYLHLQMKYDAGGDDPADRCTGAQWYTGGVSLDDRLAAVNQWITVRFRIIRHGTQAAHILPMSWPTRDADWPNGERDWCEGTQTDSCGIYLHYGSGNGSQVIGDVPVNLTRWHTLSALRRGDTFSLYVDDLSKPAWSYTSSSGVFPRLLTHAVLQQECDYSGCPTETTGTEDIQIDWIIVRNGTMAATRPTAMRTVTATNTPSAAHRSLALSCCAIRAREGTTRR